MTDAAARAERRRQAAREYRARNRERLLAQQREYQRRNRERFREYNRRYRERHPDRVKAQQAHANRNYWRAHRDELLVKQRERRASISACLHYGGAVNLGWVARMATGEAGLVAQVVAVEARRLARRFGFLRVLEDVIHEALVEVLSESPATEELPNAARRAVKRIVSGRSNRVCGVYYEDSPRIRRLVSGDSYA